MGLPLKIIVIGGNGSGKTSVIAKIIEKFNGRNVGIARLIDVKVNGSDVSFSFWEPKAGQDAASAPVTFFVGAKAVILVFDVSNRDSFESVKAWYKRALPLCGKKIPYLLVANKVDLGWAFDQNEVISFAKEHGIPLIECSATRGVNIEAIVNVVIALMEGRTPEISAPPPMAAPRTPEKHTMKPSTTSPAPTPPVPTVPKPPSPPVPQAPIPPRSPAPPKPSLPQTVTQQPEKKTPATPETKKPVTAPSPSKTILSSLDEILLKTKQITSEIKSKTVEKSAPSMSAPSEPAPAQTPASSKPPVPQMPSPKHAHPPQPTSSGQVSTEKIKPEEKAAKPISPSGLLLMTAPVEEEEIAVTRARKESGIVEDTLVKPSSLFGALKKTISERAQPSSQQPAGQPEIPKPSPMEATPAAEVKTGATESKPSLPAATANDYQKVLAGIQDIRGILKSMIAKIDYHEKNIS